MKRFAYLLLLAMGAACGKDSDSPYLDRTPAEVAFLSQRNGDGAWLLHLMNADGSNQRAVSDQNLVYAPVVPSHDGQRLLYVVNEQPNHSLYVFNKTTGATTLLVSGEVINGPAWSPDDRQIAFAQANNTPAGSNKLVIIDSDGQHPRDLVPGMPALAPQWFPDGRQIAFLGFDNGSASIFTVGADGAGRKLLSPAGLHISEFSIDPTGKQIVLVSGGQGGLQLYLLPAQGGGAKQITFSTTPPLYDIGFSKYGNYQPDWSPDGKKIAYTSWAHGSPDIFTIDANGNNDKRITRSSGREDSPQWSRDGRYIFFVNKKEGADGEVYRMKRDGLEQIPLTRNNGEEVFPVLFKK